MSQSLESLSQDALDVLRDAEVPEPPPGAEERVLTRLRVELPPVLPSQPPGEPPSSSSAPSPSSPALGRFGGPVALASLALGVVVGALLHSSFAEPRVEVRTVTVEVPVAAPAPVAVLPAPPPPPAAKKAAVVVKAPPKAKEASPDVDLARERQLVEQARSALVRGEARAAADALALHASSFPRGRLAEERESLWIQALVRQGEFARARERAARFRADFPNSLLLPAVDAALSTMPR